MLQRLPYDPAAWEATIAGHPDLEVYHGSAWLEYLAVSQGAKPVTAVVLADGRPVGHFVGAIVRRYGIQSLGSPLRGWNTESMGFLLDEGFDRRAAAEALVPFAFRELKCLHLELADRHLTAEQMAGSAYAIEKRATFLIDLRPPEAEILARLPPKTRQHVRKAIRMGVRAEIATDGSFADDYLRLLTQVFGRQGLVPTYGVDRVRALIDALQPTGQLLLLYIRSADGEILATGISLGRNSLAVAWGMGWSRRHAALYPIDFLWWERIRYWRMRGMTAFDMGGRGDYKARYGGVETPTFIFYRSRYPMLRYGRSAVRLLFRARQVLAGRRAHDVAGHGPA